MVTLISAVMCGGSGTRLWPWSRRSFPKQFLNLLDDHTLLQAAVDRMARFPASIETIVIGNEEHRFIIDEQLKSTAGAAEIVLEPEGRNTAPTALIAALRARELFGEDSLVLLAPADHVIADVAAYHAAVERAIPCAEAGYVVTFGITPDRPDTGYGYIEIGGEVPDATGVSFTQSFREKPDRATAQDYLASGRFVWNAGIFLFKASALLALAAKINPKMLALCEEASAKAKPDLNFMRLEAEPFLALENISFDYAFAERLEKHLAVVPVSMGWSDVGSWGALYGARGGNGTDNVTEGPAELFDCTGTLAFSDGPLVVAQGLKDVVVVANHDAVYVAAADRTEAVKDAVGELEKRHYSAAVTHERVFRPWGWYQTINIGERFQVKEIVVKPNAKLSLQSHHHRSEHWIVVRGTAQVTVGDETRIVTENESVYIPLRARHRLENPGRIPMHLIEVQTGSYLEEDDIVRYEDTYGRR